MLLKAAILDLTSFLIDLFIYIIKKETKNKKLNKRFAVYRMVVPKKLKEIKDDSKRAENDYRNKKCILIKLSLFEKLCLFSMKERFEKVSKNAERKI